MGLDSVKLSASSSWARAPDRDNSILIPGTPEANDERAAMAERGFFSPRLDSTEFGNNIRTKVNSSGYGAALPVVKYSEPVPQDVKEASGLTFKPDLTSIARPGSATYKMRKQAQSSGYGKALPLAKKSPVEPKPSFKPDTNLGKVAARIKKSAGSSGYGKIAAESPKKPTAEKLSFKPDIDVGKRAARLRKKAPEKTYLQPRAREYLERAASPGHEDGPGYSETHALRYTLAADRGDDEPAYVRDDGITTPFVLDGGHVGLLAIPLPMLPVFGEVNKMGERIKKGAESSGYAGNYEPKHVPAPEIPEPPRMVWGDPGLSYADTPDKVPPVKHTAQGISMLKTAQSSGFGSADYAPAVSQLPDREEVTPKWTPVTKDKPFVPVDEVPSPLKNPLTDKVASSAYGISSPPVALRPDPKPVGPRFDTSTTHSTMLAIHQLTFAPTTLPNSREEEDYEEEENGYGDEHGVMGGQFSQMPPPPNGKKAGPAVAPKPHHDYNDDALDEDDEKVTIMPL